MTNETAITERMFVMGAACVGVSNEALERLAKAGGLRLFMEAACAGIEPYAHPQARAEVEAMCQVISPLEDE